MSKFQIHVLCEGVGYFSKETDYTTEELESVHKLINKAVLGELDYITLQCEDTNDLGLVEQKRDVSFTKALLLKSVITLIEKL